MFSATVLMITMLNAGTLHDTAGPYDTKAQCEARVEQMKRDAASYYKQFGVIALEGRCKSTQSENTPA